MKEFADLTHERWETVFTTDVATFFNLISFNREYTRRQQEAMKKWQQGLK